jgi:hypothetical protein
LSEFLTFTAAGSPRAVSRTIEACAPPDGAVSALVVPWESDANTVCMAVTAVRKDGWAIEHTNLGTIRLVDAGGETTSVAVAADVPPDDERTKLAPLFDTFVRQVRNRLQGASA